jgi:superfamily I DNA/RNA helicase
LASRAQEGDCAAGRGAFLAELGSLVDGGGLGTAVEDDQGPGGQIEPGQEGSAPFSIGVAVPERQQVAKVEDELSRHGVIAESIGQDGPRKPDAVHVGTLHRFKGLEYQLMLIADASAGSIPPARAESLRAEDPERYERQLKRSRSLLFVAATRARDSLAITWHGAPSPFLPQAPGSGAD